MSGDKQHDVLVSGTVVRILSEEPQVFEVDVPSQRIVDLAGVAHDVAGHCVHARRSRKLVENAIDVGEGDHVKVIIEPNGRWRTFPIVHRSARAYPPARWTR